MSGPTTPSGTQRSEDLNLSIRSRRGDDAIEPKPLPSRGAKAEERPRLPRTPSPLHSGTPSVIELPSLPNASEFDSPAYEYPSDREEEPRRRRGPGEGNGRGGGRGGYREERDDWVAITGGPHPSLPVADKAFHQWAWRAFAQPTKCGQNKNLVDGVTRQSYRCCFGGPEPKSKSTGARHKSGKWTGCKWVARAQKCEDGWYVFVAGDHNHECRPSDLMGNASARRKYRKLMFGDDLIDRAIERLSQAFMTARNIASFLGGARNNLNQPEHARQMPPPSALRGSQGESTGVAELEGQVPITREDVRSIQNKLIKSKYGPGTSTKRFIDLLKENAKQWGIRWFVDWESNKKNVPRRFFFALKYGIENWKRNPELLVVDNTYKVGFRVFGFLCVFSAFG